MTPHAMISENKEKPIISRSFVHHVSKNSEKILHFCLDDPQPSKLKKKEKHVHNLLMWESETLELIIESRKIRDH